MTTNQTLPCRDLKPCPFCGDSMAMLMREDAYNFAVLCAHVAGKGGCGMRGPYRSNEDEAALAWNTRAQASAPEGDKQSYQDGDGCPTEMSVLKRFWREHQLNKAPEGLESACQCDGDRWKVGPYWTCKKCGAYL